MIIKTIPRQQQTLVFPQEQLEQQEIDAKEQSESDVEIAHVFRRYSVAYRAAYGPLSTIQDRVLRQLELCRTAGMGGHRNQCELCGYLENGYNSCNHRHCPKCRGKVRAKWYEAREAEMLPVDYYHLVLTVPDQIAQLMLVNSVVGYRTLFKAAAQALSRMGITEFDVKFGFIAVLHTWGEVLNFHPHLHILLPGGGLRNGRWLSLARGTKLPEDILRKEFTERFLRMLETAYHTGELVLADKFAELKNAAHFGEWLSKLRGLRWVVFTEGAQSRGADGHGAGALKYLARYASGMAISNGRLESIDNDRVYFTYKDYRDGGRRKKTSLAALEFIHRLLQHVQQPGSRHIRHYGFMSHNRRTIDIPMIKRQLGVTVDEPLNAEEANDEAEDSELVEPPEKPDRMCRKCRVGVMVQLWNRYRPTVAEIMRMCLPLSMWTVLQPDTDIGQSDGRQPVLSFNSGPKPKMRPTSGIP